MYPPLCAMVLRGFQTDKASTTQTFMLDDLRPQNLEKGWSTLAKTLTENDEVKVRDCKEDMDTLLVFVSSPSTAPVIRAHSSISSVYRLASSRQCSRPSTSNHTRACKSTQRPPSPLSSCIYPRSCRVFLSARASSTRLSRLYHKYPNSTPHLLRSVLMPSGFRLLSFPSLRPLLPCWSSNGFASTWRKKMYPLVREFACDIGASNAIHPPARSNAHWVGGLTVQPNRHARGIDLQNLFVARV